MSEARREIVRLSIWFAGADADDVFFRILELEEFVRKIANEDVRGNEGRHQREAKRLLANENDDE
jgi:hypothetical protein